MRVGKKTLDMTDAIVATYHGQARMIQILARRDHAQRERLADDDRSTGREAPHPLNERRASLA